MCGGEPGEFKLTGAGKCIPYPTSCKALNPPTSGVYELMPPKGPRKPVKAYCHVLGTGIFTSIPCNRLTDDPSALVCEPTNSVAGGDSCSNRGYKFLPPRTREHLMDSIRQFGPGWHQVMPVIATGDGYSSRSGCGCAMAKSPGGGARACPGWRSPDDGDWFLAGTPLGTGHSGGCTPSGDYDEGCFLHTHLKPGEGIVDMNDHNCVPVAKTYLCSTSEY